MMQKVCEPIYNVCSPPLVILTQFGFSGVNVCCVKLTCSATKVQLEHTRQNKLYNFYNDTFWQPYHENGKAQMVQN